jgi:arsenate reductase (thioredoxin)
MPLTWIARRRLVCLMLLAGTSTWLGAQVPRPTTVLFLCPHGAAKSVLASAHFAHLAAERGLRVKVDFAGTEPDPAVAPQVAEHLEKQGLAPLAPTPRLVTAADVDAADIVISLGCDLAAIPGGGGKNVRQWDVPGPGEHLVEADAAIRARVVALVDELLRQQR